MTQQRSDDLEVAAMEWADSQIQIKYSDIGGYSIKAIIHANSLIKDLRHGSAEEYCRKVHLRIRATSGKITPFERILKVSSARPVEVVDRHKSFWGKLLTKITRGKYRRYSRVNPYVEVVLAITRKEISMHMLNENEVYLTAIPTSSKSLSKKYFVELTQTWEGYTAEGLVDAKH